MWLRMSQNKKFDKTIEINMKNKYWNYKKLTGHTKNQLLVFCNTAAVFIVTAEPKTNMVRQHANVRKSTVIMWTLLTWTSVNVMLNFFKIWGSHSKVYQDCGFIELHNAALSPEDGRSSFTQKIGNHLLG